MTEEDAYRALNVERSASPAQIRQAYLDLVKVWHPDRFEHDARLREKAVRSLQEVNEAYAWLQRAAPRSRPADGTRSSSAPPHTPPPAAATPTPPPEPSATHAPASPTTAVWRRYGHYRVPILAGSLIGVVLAAALIRLLTTGAPSPASPEVARADNATDIELPARRPRVEPPRRRAAPRPESGVDIRPAQGAGNGTLSISNDARDDAVVVIQGEVGHRRALYVRHGEKITMLDVAPGDYDVQVMLGRDWLGRAFAEPAGYLALAAPVRVRSTGTGTATAAITLAARVAGARQVPAFALE